MLFLCTYYVQIMRMKPLREQIEREEFDYQSLMDALSDYAEPRRKVSALLRSGEIIRVKKGCMFLARGFGVARSAGSCLRT